MKKLLVTGATGFLGRHIMDVLLDPSVGMEERVVRVLVRGDNPWEGNARVETAKGDILDRDAVEAAVDGVDCILHLAGAVSRDPADGPRLFQIHIEGTRHVLEAALSRRTARVIVSSSSGTIAASRGPAMHTEDAPYAVEVAGRWPYYLSKIYQEKLAFSYHEKHGLPVLTLNPSLLLGPGDYRLSSTGDIQLYLDRRITNIPAGGLNFVDARDAATVFVAAIERGQTGRRYLVGGHNMAMREFFYLIQWVSGVRAPLLSLSEEWSRRGASVLRRGMELFGRQYPLNDLTIEMAYRFWYCDSSRAKKELGLAPRAPDETVRDTVAFLRALPPRAVAS